MATTSRRLGDWDVYKRWSSTQACLSCLHCLFFISEKPRFAGFKEPERERIAKHFTNNFNLDMLDRFNSFNALGKKILNCSITRELSVKGWNWGVANFNGSVLNFEV